MMDPCALPWRNFRINDNRLRVFFIAVISIVIVSFASPSRASITAEVEFNSTKEQIIVHYCFPAFPAAPLYRSSSSALPAFSIVSGTGRFVENQLIIEQLDNTGCIGYRVDLGQLSARQLIAIAEGYVISTSAWLYGPKENPFRLSIINPQGLNISTPWKQLSPNTFELDWTALAWSNRIAFGRFTTQSLKIHGATVNLALTNISQDKHHKIHKWIEEAATALTALYGRYPVTKTQVLVIDIGHHDEPVPWAEVQRGGSPSVQFFIDSRWSQSAFRADWTAVHEFSHLLIPYLDLEKRWIPEGIATYYQNVLRARHHMLTPQQGWRNLERGFAKGKRFANNTSLNNSHSFKHLYWGGAALFLKADIALRTQSNGAQSLATTLEKLASCCLAPRKQWDSDTFMHKLDELSQSTIFTQLLYQDANLTRFPVIAELPSVPTSRQSHSLNSEIDAIMRPN